MGRSDCRTQAHQDCRRRSALSLLPARHAPPFLSFSVSYSSSLSPSFNRAPPSFSLLDTALSLLTHANSSPHSLKLHQNSSNSSSLPLTSPSSFQILHFPFKSLTFPNLNRPNLTLTPPGDHHQPAAPLAGIAPPRSTSFPFHLPLSSKPILNFLSLKPQNLHCGGLRL